MQMVTRQFTIRFFFYIQVCGVSAKLIIINNNSFINCVCHQKCKYKEMISTEIMGLITYETIFLNNEHT